VSTDGGRRLFQDQFNWLIGELLQSHPEAALEHLPVNQK
jgi:hypothetical protein